MIDWSLVTITLVVIGMGITIMGFQWRQNVAMERRLREDMRTSERRLREDSQGLESRLREDSRTLETRLQEDSQGLESRLREDNRTLEIRLQEDNQASESRLRENIRTLEIRLQEDNQAIREPPAGGYPDTRETSRNDRRRCEDSHRRSRSDKGGIAGSL